MKKLILALLFTATAALAADDTAEPVLIYEKSTNWVVLSEKPIVKNGKPHKRIEKAGSVRTNLFMEIGEAGPDGKKNRIRIIRPEAPNWGIPTKPSLTNVVEVAQ